MNQITIITFFTWIYDSIPAATGWSCRRVEQTGVTGVSVFVVRSGVDQFSILQILQVPDHC